MFSHLMLSSNSQLSEKQIAHLLIKEAIDQLATITNHSKEQCINMLAAQMPIKTRQALPYSQKRSRFINEQAPILEPCERQFIHQLFH